MNILSLLSYYNSLINNFIWNKLGLFALGFVGVLATFSLKFFQLKHFKLWCVDTLKNTFKKQTPQKNKSAISPFQSMCASLAATLGVGNIVGVSSAIYVGGPGAIFWMWVAGFFGMITGYSENVLGAYFRRKNFNGDWCGGPMYYLEDGVGAKKGLKKLGRLLALLFSFFALLASFGIGSMGQVNKIVINLESAFPIKSLCNINLYHGVSAYSLLIGVVLFFVALFVTIGGVKRLGKVTERLVPFMVIFFLLGSFMVILKNYVNIIPAFKAIFTSAFTPAAGCGGILGTAFRHGIKRGVFTNEAGMGSSPMIHANSNIKEPAEHGMLSMFEIFFDTIVVCTVTALVILTSGVYNLSGNVGTATESTMVAKAFDSVFSYGGFGQKFVAIAILLFSFSSVLGWNHYGSKAWEYIFGTKTVFVYKLLHIASIVAGALLTSSVAWDISDTFNGLMILPNLVGVTLLFGKIKKVTCNYIDRKVKGKNIEPFYSEFSDIQKKAQK